MNLQKYKDFISNIHNFIINFENQKLENQKEIKNIGVVYTPKEITAFIIENIFKFYFETKHKINIIKENSIDYSRLIQYINQNDNNKENLLNTLKRIKILDPSCGSGRFLISAAIFIYNLWRKIDPNSITFHLKKEIIQNNLYGVDIDEFTCQISKLRLFEWLISENDEFFNNNQDKLESLNFENLSTFFKKLDTNFNIFHTDYLLKFSSKEKFDVIIGNPPYVENKKISNRELKKDLYKKFKSAYKLFDLSVLFLEKSLDLLNDNCGLLSFLITNKFLSADYGIKIREILIRNSEIKELVNISSLKLFNKTATYPIIIFLKKGYLNSSNSILIKTYNTSNEFLAKESNPNLNILPQSLLEMLPAHVIPIKG
ncbi:MAG TPA: N-6 DNA methylase, partial [Candidatus Lokiarchaeia archaeon]